MTAINDHRSLLLALGGAPALVEPLGTLGVNIRAWVARNRIPPEYWADVIRLAEQAAITITAEWLVETMPSKRRPDNGSDHDASDMASDRPQSPEIGGGNFPIAAGGAA